MNIRIIPFLLVVGLLCSTAFGAAEPAALKPCPSDRSGLNGAELYREHCAGCHHPLKSTLKPQRSASRIRSSIEHFPAMHALSCLTDAEVQAIAAALATVSNN